MVSFPQGPSEESYFSLPRHRRSLRTHLEGEALSELLGQEQVAVCGLLPHNKRLQRLLHLLSTPFFSAPTAPATSTASMRHLQGTKHEVLQVGGTTTHQP